MVPWLRFIVQARVNSNNFGRLLFTLHRLLERESEYSLVAPRCWLGELCRQVRRIKCIYSSPEAAAWPGMNNRFLGNYLLSPALRKGWNWNWNECHRGSGWVVVCNETAAKTPSLDCFSWTGWRRPNVAATLFKGLRLQFGSCTYNSSGLCWDWDIHIVNGWEYCGTVNQICWER